MSTPEDEHEGIPVDPVTGLPALTLGAPISASDVAAALDEDEDLDESKAAERARARAAMKDLSELQNELGLTD